MNQDSLDDRPDCCEWPDCDTSDDLRLCEAGSDTTWLCEGCRSEVHNVKVVR
jgi:hypothetical protein